VEIYLQSNIAFAMIEGMSRCYTVCEAATLSSLLTHILGYCVGRFQSDAKSEAIIIFAPICVLIIIVLAYRALSKVLGKGNNDIYFNFTSSMSTVTITLCAFSIFIQNTYNIKGLFK